MNFPMLIDIACSNLFIKLLNGTVIDIYAPLRNQASRFSTGTGQTSFTGKLKGGNARFEFGP